MPRDGSQVYSVPVGTDGVPNTTILSAKYNTFIHDVETDLNTPRPVVAGGTGATSSDSALVNLSAEKAAQVVTNWDSTVWMPGSFYAAATATGAAPVAGHAFAGVVVINEPLVSPPTNQNVVVEALDVTAPGNIMYVRIQKSGVWGPWRSTGFQKKNYIVNGAMMASQENGTAAGTATQYFPVDQFMSNWSNTGTNTVQQVAVATPGGSPNRFRYTATVADASATAAKYALIVQRLEGVRVADLRSGSASAKTITIQFGVKAPAGTYCVALHNATYNRSYVAEYVIAAGEANTDVVKSVTIALDQTGTWAVDNTLGIDVSWCLMCGSTFQTPAGAWAAGNLLGSANQINFLGTAGNVFELFDVGLYEGTVAPPFVVPDYPSEVTLCQRYWRRTRYGTGIATSITSVRMVIPYWGMRAGPTVSSAAGITLSDLYSANPGQAAFGVTVFGAQSGDLGHFDYANFTAPNVVVGRFYAFYASGTDVLLNARL